MLSNLALNDPKIGGFIPQVEYPGDNCCILYEKLNYDWNSDQPGLNKETFCHDGQRTEFTQSDLGRWH